jgi:5-formyltetrahydrofolate cyclo-ligase
MISKQDLRNQARERRAELAAMDRGLAFAIARLSRLLEIPEGAVVASYWPVRDEADPRDLAIALSSQGHPIALPRIVGPVSLEFRLWRHGDALSPNPQGIHEPAEHIEVVDPKVLLVPLLAFDKHGYRLGYGGGYYDRTLADLRTSGHIVAIGVAYAGQEMDSLPHDPHDQRLDKIVTENGIRTFGT